MYKYKLIKKLFISAFSDFLDKNTIDTSKNISLKFRNIRTLFNNFY